MRIDWNEAGFVELLTSPATKGMLLGEHVVPMMAAANAVPSTTSPPTTERYYDFEDGTTTRARYRIHTTTARAAAHEAKTHALQAALSVAGGGLQLAPRYRR